MAGLLTTLYVLVMMAFGIAGVFYMMWTGEEGISTPSKRSDYLRAVAVTAFFVYMVGAVLV